MVHRVAKQASQNESGSLLPHSKGRLWSSQACLRLVFAAASCRKSVLRLPRSLFASGPPDESQGGRILFRLAHAGNFGQKEFLVGKIASPFASHHEAIRQ